ncbi:MAG: hypothetical protein HYY13_08230 [Nitrospirae bacterium]|nr:hypothetical protein [Nitrospirota bacterium]
MPLERCRRIFWGIAWVAAVAASCTGAPTDAGTGKAALRRVSVQELEQAILAELGVTGEERPSLYVIEQDAEALYDPADGIRLIARTLSIHTRRNVGFTPSATERILSILEAKGIERQEGKIWLYGPDGVKSLRQVREEAARQALPIRFPRVFTIKIVDPKWSADRPRSET